MCPTLRTTVLVHSNGTVCGDTAMQVGWVHHQRKLNVTSNNR
jgi:hypothetical protein